MSDASPGNGLIIIAVKEALKKDLEGTRLKAEALLEIRSLMADPVSFRRNMDRPTSEALVLYAGQEMTPKESELAELTLKEHSNQDTNLKHSWFGQWRKAMANGKVSIQPLDDVLPKFRARFAQDLGMDWTPEEIVSYKERGQNPPAEFWDLPIETKLAWLIGRPLRPVSESADQELNTLWDPPAPTPVVIPTLERVGRPATDEDILGDTWGSHCAAVAKGIRIDLGGKDKPSLMARKLGTQDLDISHRALTILGKYRILLQAKADECRKKFVSGPSATSAQAISELLDFMNQPVPEVFVTEFAAHPEAARHRTQFREQLEKLRAGSQKRIGRRLDEMLRRCPKAA